MNQEGEWGGRKEGKKTVGKWDAGKEGKGGERKEENTQQYEAFLEVHMDEGIPKQHWNVVVKEEIGENRCWVGN